MLRSVTVEVISADCTRLTVKQLPHLSNNTPVVMARDSGNVNSLCIPGNNVDQQ